MNIDKLPKRLPDNSYVVLDIELFGADKNKLHRPTGEFACLSYATSPEDVGVITNPQTLDLLMGRLDNCVICGHNLEFDLQHIRRWAKVEPQSIWCTMIMERILYSGWYDRFSLKDLARRYLDVHLDKEVRDQFQDATELTEELIQYSAKDAEITYKVFLAQKEMVHKNPWAFKVWKECDMPVHWPFLDRMGFRVDKTEWMNLAEANQQRADILKASFDFNPASPAQVKKALIGLGFRGLPSTGESILEKYINKDPHTDAAIMARKVLDFRGSAKLASTYGVNWENFMEQEDDNVYVIYANHQIVGTETGRTAVKNPPLHNVPLRKNPEFRKPFIARPNNVLIVADWSAQEPFVHAYFSQDDALLKIINSGEDIYVETSKIFGKPIEKSDPYRNERIKPTYLGSIYGLTPQGMSTRYDVPLEECEELQRLFRNAFPKSAEWCDNQRNKDSYVETILGRRFWLNPYHSQKEENALNAPHQGTGADILKIALSELYKGWDWACPFGFVHQNHDEIILDVPRKYAPDAAHFLQETMERVGKEMVKGQFDFRASAKIVDNWLEAK